MQRLSGGVRAAADGKFGFEWFPGDRRGDHEELRSGLGGKCS